MRLGRGTRLYRLAAARERFRAGVDFFRAEALRTLAERPHEVSFGGAPMILRTAATRSELRPRIWPISSGVGTGLPIMWALISLL
jgi:hypothetical protein